MNILHLDDDKFMLFITRKLLEIKGHRVTSKSRPEEIHKYIYYYNPDIVIIDYGMYKLNGLDVLKRLGTYEHIFTILFTGRTNELSIDVGQSLSKDEQASKYCELLGFNGFVSKSWSDWGARISRIIDERSKIASKA